MFGSRLRATGRFLRKLAALRQHSCRQSASMAGVNELELAPVSKQFEEEWMKPAAR